MIERLQETITQEYLGIIWTTDETLLKRPYPFFHLDYFLNGLLANFVANNKKNGQKTVVFSTSFGHPFFLAHVEKNNLGNKESLSEIIKLAETKRGPFNRILIMGENGLDLLNFMETQFKKFTFDLLD